MTDIYICPNKECKDGTYICCKHTTPHKRIVFSFEQNKGIGCNDELGEGRCPSCVLINQEWDK